MDRAVADHLHSVDEYWKKGADIGGNDRISEMVRRAISSADESWLVAESDGKLVGFFSAEIMPAIPVFEPERIGLISDAYLEEAFRGKGIAKEAVSQFLKWFRENGVKSAELNVATRNPEAMRAWEGLGFTEYLKKMRLEL